MNSNFVLRTEEIKTEEILKYYVEMSDDDVVLGKLQSKMPIILVGSRGMGKSFLFKVSQIKVEESKKEKIIPVFVTFRQAPMIQTGNSMQFYEWMLNRICTNIIRALKDKGYIVNNRWTFNGEDNGDILDSSWIKKLETVNARYEESWRKPGEKVDNSDLPTIDDLLELLEDICNASDIDRFIVYIDEAAHVFIPNQQIQFFSLFRELRSPYIKCNASVYPGVTYYGNTFDKTHDAEFVTLTRSITDDRYVEKMKDVVLRQITDESLRNILEENGERFSVLAYAASGNPRVLLRSIEKIGNLKTDTINKFIREFYREEIWAEHSSLVDKYPRSSKYIDWGRNFVEEAVLPELKNKNDRLLEKDEKETTIYLWVDRSAPEAVKEALRILEYTGLLRLNAQAVKATGSVIGTRYEVNLGCLLAQEPYPITRCMDIVNNLTVRKLNEYGANSKRFDELKGNVKEEELANSSDDLLRLLDNSIDALQLTEWQKEKLKEINVKTIKDLLLSEENDLKKIYYVGDYKSRHMKNVAMAALFEYLY